MLTCTIYTSNRWQIFRISCAKTFENKLQKIVCILFGVNSVIAISNVVGDINSAYSENLMQKATRDPLVIRFQSEVVKMARDSNYCRLNLFHSICKRFLIQCVSKYLCLIYAKYYIHLLYMISYVRRRSLYCAIILRTICTNSYLYCAS